MGVGCDRAACDRALGVLFKGVVSCVDTTRLEVLVCLALPRAGVTGGAIGDDLEADALPYRLLMPAVD